MPDSPVGHADHGFVVGFEDQADIQGDGAVAADGLPVIAAVEHFAREPLAFEDAAKNGADPTDVSRRGANDLHAGAEAHHKQRPGPHAGESLRQIVEQT